MTMEAWDWKYKNNLDWNHAWGAAPANIIPRFLLGVRPIEPGFAKVLIQPQPGSLRRVSGTVPTPRGPIEISIEHDDDRPFVVKINIPATMTAKVGLPQSDRALGSLVVDGKKVEAQLEGGSLYYDNLGSGFHVLAWGQSR